MNFYSKKRKTVLTEDDDFYNSKNPFTTPQNKLNVTKEQFWQPKNLNNSLPSNPPNNVQRSPQPSWPNNAPKVQTHIPQNNLEGILLQGMVKEVLTGEKRNERLAEQERMKQTELELKNAQRKFHSSANISPSNEHAPQQGATRPLSKEEEWYPVSTAQRNKEEEDRIWIANNPNASLAEMMYPSMRKKPTPLVQPANLSENFRSENKEIFDNIAEREAKQTQEFNNNPPVTHEEKNVNLKEKREAEAKKTPENLAQRTAHKEDIKEKLTNEFNKEQGDIHNFQNKQKEQREKQLIKKTPQKNERVEYHDVRTSFPYNKLTPEQNEKAYGIKSVGNSRRRDSFPYNKLSLEQQDLWIYPKEKRARVDQTISINPLVQKQYASITSSARRAEKFEADFPTLFQQIEEENTQTVIMEIQEKHKIHAQNNLVKGINTSLPSKQGWVVRERDLDLITTGFTNPIQSRLNWDVIHQLFETEDGTQDIGFNKDEPKGRIGKDNSLKPTRINEEFEGIVLHDTYLNAAINILKKKYGPGTYKLAVHNCQSFIEEVIKLGDDIAKTFGESIYLNSVN